MGRRAPATGRRPARSADDPFADVSVDAFRRFMIVSRGMSTSTVQVHLHRLEHAGTNGFDAGAFLQGAHAAHQEASRWLERRLLKGATVDAYNNDVRLLNLLAAWQDLREVRFRKRRDRRRAKRPLDREDLDRVWRYRHAVPEVHRFRRALITIALASGLRVGELAQLELQDLDARRSRLHVRHPEKGGLERWLPMPRWIWSRKRPVGAYLASRPRPRRQDRTAVWVLTPSQFNATGPARRSTSDVLRRSLHHVGKDLGVRLNFNVTRHTCATSLLLSRKSLVFIQFFLGHSSVATTAQYLNLDPLEIERQYQQRPLKDPFQEGVA